jgi:hypothetical protein
MRVLAPGYRFAHPGYNFPACDLTPTLPQTIERPDFFTLSRKQEPDGTRTLYH